MTTLRFEVDGTPVPQGSMRMVPTGRGLRVIHNKDGPMKRWRKDIADIARVVAGVPKDAPPRWPKDIAVILHITFRLPRPKSYPKRVVWPVYKGDVDKLARAVFDACTGILYADDGQVVRATITKRYVQPDQSPGVTISARAAGTNAAAERKAA